ncbi:hypothetical protein [Mycobacteroides abscessus]|uniref:hypothetical protein n=1 Tax=Mycobacteroides abscessus TaxID=36809 RepID=UPI00046A987F|nr:hypothetical protein [Mycobacteroides abscessus]
MSHRIARNVKAERVRLALLEARPGGLTTQQLCTTTGLTASQVRTGLTEIKEHAAIEHLTPLTWSYRDGYCFSREPSDWIAYERAQVHSGLTRFVRLIKGTAYPHAQLEPDDDWIRLVCDQLIGVRAMLEGITRQ